jgi:2-polyprenyl-6-methoxyphenol hydroxylase-like FAD-dependent oxidoreductase
MNKERDNNQPLDNMDKSSEQNRNHAIVIGGSLSGLLAARILSDHFDQVTIVERDAYADEPTCRKGVPQARHLHVLLLGGLKNVERLLPGFRADMLRAGAREVDSGADLAWLTPAGWGLSFHSGLNVLTFSRALLDWVVRKRMVQFDNVRFITESEVSSLLFDKENSRISGVTLQHRNRANENDVAESLLRADLVVDASGRGSRAPQWLSELGLNKPRETVVNAFLGYASRIYQPSADFNAGWKALALQAAPPKRNRGALLFPIEGNRWLLTIVGGDKDYPPTDEEGFLGFIQSLPSSSLYEAIKSATPLSPIYGYRGTENRLRHYEEEAMPDGFVLLGDAVCAFNPVYGQGITVASLGAHELDRCLSEQRKSHPDGSLRGLSGKFQKRLARINAVPWTMATSVDYRYKGTVGGNLSWTDRLLQRYMDHVLGVTTENARVRLQWLKVFHLLEHPTTLFQPKIIFQVLRRLVVNSFKKMKSTDEPFQQAQASASS